MYSIKCDDHVIYDPRASQLKVLSAKCSAKVNSAGGASFTILSDHPHYDDLKKLKSVIEFQQDGATIFRGRMTDDSRSFHKQLVVQAEGVLACTNDTIIPPFTFPEGFPDAPTASDEENAVEYFLNWVIGKHNEHVQDWQKLKLGTVTVRDPNNVITRSSENYASTWEILKSKLFDSELGGYLYVRYEADGNYVDYVESFRLTNLQRITLTDNVLDIVTDSDCNATYTAILPLGATVDEDWDGDFVVVEGATKRKLTLRKLPDGDLTDDLVKSGEYIYSRSGVAQYGWICMPIAESTWDDVTLAENLQKNAITALAGGLMLARTITIKAVDLHLADEDVPTIKVFRNIILDIPTHGINNETLPLTELETDILNPQNTVITLGETVRSMTDINQQDRQDAQNQIEKVEDALKDVNNNNEEIEQIQDDLVNVSERIYTQSTQVISDCESIILGALESYVQTGDYEQYKKTVSSRLSALADEIVIQFNEVTESINTVKGDLKAEITDRQKRITFSEDGISIGAGENAMQLKLDNDKISFMKNNQEFGWWDGNNFHTGNVKIGVNERAQFGAFAFVPRTDGSLMFLKVGG